jgi:hypothetical protein
VDVPGISFAIMWLNALQAYCPFAMGSGPNRSEEVRHYIAVGSGDIVSLHRCGFSTTLFIEVISKKWVREGRGNRIGWSC